MTTKQKPSTRHELIRCQNCGEDYSATYRRCPFCDEYTAHQTEQHTSDTHTTTTGRGGGKRVQPRRGGGYGSGRSVLHIFTTVFSLALIVAAVFIVLTLIKPMIDRGDADPEITPSVDVTPTPSTTPEITPTPEVTPEVTPSVTPEVTPDVTVGQVTGLSLSSTDVTLRSAGETFRPSVTFSPAGTTGDVVWSSSNPAVASVSANGTVTAITPGTVTITASVGDVSAECIVRGSFATPNGGSDSNDNGNQSNGDLSLSHSDVTLHTQGERFTLQVSGTSASASYSSSNTSVATVSSSGQVTAVSSGKTTITVTVGGETMKCTVRCNF